MGSLNPKRILIKTVEIAEIAPGSCPMRKFGWINAKDVHSDTWCVSAEPDNGTTIIL